MFLAFLRGLSWFESHFHIRGLSWLEVRNKIAPLPPPLESGTNLPSPPLVALALPNEGADGIEHAERDPVEKAHHTPCCCGLPAQLTAGRGAELAPSSHVAAHCRLAVYASSLSNVGCCRLSPTAAFRLQQKVSPHAKIGILFALAMPNYYRQPWRDCTACPGHQGSDERVIDLTGWPPAVLDVVWEAHRDTLPNTNARKGTQQDYFYLAYRFIKLGPRVRELASVLHTPGTGHVGKKLFYTHVAPIIIGLGLTVNQIHWENRLATDNHCVMFPVGVTGIVDCFPIRVLTPRDYRTKKLLNQPKYKGCVFKVQLVISLTGMWYVSLDTSSYFSPLLQEKLS